MKKFFTILGIIVLVAVAAIGGALLAKNHSTTDSYKTAMTAGKTAVKNSDYEEAKTQFSSALNAKKDDYTATTYLEQTKNFIKGQAAAELEDYDTAISFYQQVTGANKGYSVLIQRANDAIATIKSAQASSTSASSSSEAASSSSAAASSSSSASSASSDENEGVGSDKSSSDDKDAMGNKITAKEIAEARKTLDANGIQSGAFSDTDIKGFIKKASDPTSGGLVQVVQEFINNGNGQ
jgi:tetratricopeptide (TPR) repeat protein